MRKAFFVKSFLFMERGILASNFKFSDLGAWRDFNKTFCDIPQHIPECQSFHPYSILTRHTKVETVAY